jgi:hypothetical protein
LPLPAEDGTGERQACLRSYFATNTELRARPSGWNIIAKGIVGGLVPLVKEGLANGVEELMDAVITEQLTGLTAGLPFEIRRVELTPSGAYFVVARDYRDSQYAAMKLAGEALADDLGLLCRPELGDSDFVHLDREPMCVSIPKRGISH